MLLMNGSKVSLARIERKQNVSKDIGCRCTFPPAAGGWRESNQVQFNAKKTQTSIFSKKIHVPEPDIIMAQQTIALSATITSLGVEMDTNMSWHNHIAGIAKAAGDN
ncbi:uncharacterized protein [Leptinotarsa decemlineata]|uniref:uncharacterized protein n=1 Tax=Leptinotarsa decemlineata TaxID=7539 RepID=UPI003D30D308